MPEQSAPEPNLWLLKVQAQVCHRGLVLTLCPVQTWALGVPAPMVPGDPALGRTSGFPAQVYGVGPGFVWAHGQVGDLQTSQLKDRIISTAQGQLFRGGFTHAIFFSFVT